MRLAVGDGLTDSSPEFEAVLNTLADFLDKDAIAAELIAGIQEFIFCGVVDIVAIDGEFQRVGRMSKGIRKAKFLVVGLVLIAIRLHAHASSLFAFIISCRKMCRQSPRNKHLNDCKPF